MELQHVNVKLFIDDPSPAATAALVPVFHRWIQEHAAPELLIDVADYRHVPDGPGVMIIGHEADYSLDHTGGRWGVRYNRKAVLEGDNQTRLEQAARSALDAFQRLESDPILAGQIRLNGREFELFINDRLLAPNDAATRHALQDEVAPFLHKLLGGDAYTLSFPEDPRRLLSLSVKTASVFTTHQLLANL